MESILSLHWAISLSNMYSIWTILNFLLATAPAAPNDYNILIERQGVPVRTTTLYSFPGDLLMLYAVVPY